MQILNLKFAFNLIEIFVGIDLCKANLISKRQHQVIIQRHTIRNIKQVTVFLSAKHEKYFLVVLSECVIFFWMSWPQLYRIFLRLLNSQSLAFLKYLQKNDLLSMNYYGKLSSNLLLCCALGMIQKWRNAKLLKINIL